MDGHDDPAIASPTNSWRTWNYTSWGTAKQMLLFRHPPRGINRGASNYWTTGNFSRSHPLMPCRRLKMRLKPLSIRIFAATVLRFPVAQ
jgi:hypothetical protein